MKKVAIASFVVVLVLISSCFTIRVSAQNKINHKIEVLNKNGFNVTYNSHNLPAKIVGNGEMQIVDAQKALVYLVSKQADESEMKETIENLIDIFDSPTKQKALEGTTFSYSFELNIITSKLDLNITLAKLSIILMDKLASSQDNHSSKTILKLINNQDIRININEEGRYKLKDISLGSDGVLISLRDVNGDKNSLNIGLFKIIGEESENLVFEEIRAFYNEKDKNIDSKLTISSIVLSDHSTKIKMNDILFYSNHIYANEMLRSTNRVSFGEFMLNQNYLSSDVRQNIDLKETHIEFFVDKIPYKKYKNLMKAVEEYDDEIFSEVFEDFFLEFSKNQSTIVSKAEAANYVVDDSKIFEKLKYEAVFDLNKNFSMNKLENLKDIFEKVDIKIDLDKNSAQKITKFMRDIEDISFVDSGDLELKRLRIELKDGLYINGKKILKLEELNF
ncbi:MAG: hypothetical protein GX780_04800 [Campylobacteraceae bacterium]|nr:hypothetical protein [Campylobacteraceae bacterium]